MPKCRFRLLAALACCALVLGGCVLPERYISRIKIERDGSYKLYVEGTAVHMDTVKALRAAALEEKSGKLKPEDVKKRKDEVEGKLREALAKFKDDKRILAAASIGEGRVRFTLSGVWAMDRDALVFSEREAPISFGVGPDGTIRLRVKDAVPGREVKTFGVKTEGDLSVVLAAGIEVLEHNAQSAPTSPNGAYRWHITEESTAAPYLKIRLPDAAAAAAPPQKKLVGHGETR
jgi:hypothetical protein